MRYRWEIVPEGKYFRLTIFSWRWPSGFVAMSRHAKESFYSDWSLCYRSAAKAEAARDKYFNELRHKKDQISAAYGGELEI